MHDAAAAHSVDTSAVRRSFDRASRTYDGAAVLQSEVRGALLERLDLTPLEPRLVVDAGAGTGHACRALKRRYTGAAVMALDLSFEMLRAARRQQSWLRPFTRVCAAAEKLPLPDACADLIISNLMLQWSDTAAAFAEFRRALAPQGLLSFTTLGPDTLHELRAAWHAADRGDAHPPSRVGRFLDMHDIGDALVRAGFAAPVLDVERYTLWYTDVEHLAADLGAVGSRNATVGRPRGLTGRRRFAALCAGYEAFRRDGRLPATYEVVFGHAWAPVAGPVRGGGRTARVSLDDLKAQLPTRRGA